MTITVTKQQFSLYIRIAMGFLLLNMVGDIIGNTDTFLTRIGNHIWLILYLLVFNFLLFEYTIPSIKLNWKRMVVGLLLLWVHIMFYSFGLYAWRNLGIGLNVYTSLKNFEKTLQAVGFFFGYSMASIFFFGIVRHIYRYRKLKIAAQQLRIEKQEAELNYLKSQTNPHFLFNTLNNIYALARDKSDLAPESILRLSKILRYMLYETGGAYIAIEQELKIIDDYIALEKLRYDDSLLIHFNYDVEDMKQALPPLLLVPLVENAFKHGVSETRNQPFVNIHLSVRKRQLVFVVKNSAEGYTAGQAVQENIGLSNLRRQLELLYTTYSLVTAPGAGIFTTTLTINLATHV